MQEFFAAHWSTVLLALAAIVALIIGSAIKKLILIVIGVALIVFALLNYTELFGLLASHT